MATNNQVTADDILDALGGQPTIIDHLKIWLPLPGQGWNDDLEQAFQATLQQLLDAGAVYMLHCAEGHDHVGTCTVVPANRRRR